MNIDTAAHANHQSCQSEMGYDRYQRELDERDEKYEAGNQDETRYLGVAPSQDTELYWLCGSSKIMCIVSSIQHEAESFK